MISTKYGMIMGETNCVFYKKGSLKSIKLEKENIIETKYGKLIPRYEIDETRTRDREAIEFFEDGSIKSIYFQKPTIIETKKGKICCEFITFYNNGNVHRIFPTYGKVSGTWSEEDEIMFSKPIKLHTKHVHFNNRISCICFYENEAIKSVSLYTLEHAKVGILESAIEVRLGISFYEDEEIKSIEPAKPTLINTDIGMIIAYDNSPLGVHGDCNSLMFTKDKQILKITTLHTGIIATNKIDGHEIFVEALRKTSCLDIDKFEMFPIVITFCDEKVMIKDSNDECFEFDKNEYEISTYFNMNYVEEGCSNECNSCSGCKG